MASINSLQVHPSAARHASFRLSKIQGRWIYITHPLRVRGGRTGAAILASEEAGRLVTEGKKKFDSGDRMGALQLWENALAANPDAQQRQTALFNSTCVHAGFGDVELAQITLRDAVQSGLDFRAAAEDPTAISSDMVRLVASQQVLIRLRKFNEAILKAAGAAAPPPFSSSSSGGGGGGGGSGSAGPMGRSSKSGSKRTAAILDEDLSKMLETDMQGIDTSVFGIIRRVALLLLALSGLGAALFYIGIQYLFPEN